MPCEGTRTPRVGGDDIAQSWQNFFGTHAQVAITAFSIMFLAIQVRSAVWRDEGLLAVAAWSALVELFAPVLASMLALMNVHPWQAASAIAGGLGLTMVFSHWFRYARRRSLPRHRRRRHKCQRQPKLIS